MNRLTSIRAALAALVLLAGCAPATNSGEDGYNQNVLTRAQLEAAQVSTLYDAIHRLRPRWLTTRAERSFGLSTEIVVFQNQTLLGGVDVLRQLSPNIAARVRYLDSATATASLPGLGSRHVEGAVVIETVDW